MALRNLKVPEDVAKSSAANDGAAQENGDLSTLTMLQKVGDIPTKVRKTPRNCRH